MNATTSLSGALPIPATTSLTGVLPSPQAGAPDSEPAEPDILHLFGRWRDDTPEQITDAARGVERWLGGENVELTPEQLNMVRGEIQARDAYFLELECQLRGHAAQLQARAAPHVQEMNQPQRLSDIAHQMYTAGRYAGDCEMAQRIMDAIHKARVVAQGES